MAKSKLSIEEIESVLRQSDDLGAEGLVKILENLEGLLEDDEDATPTPRVTYKSVFVANDSAGELIDTPMAVVQVPEDFDEEKLLDKISEIGIIANNDAQQAKKSKLKKNPLKSIADILENCPKKYFKDLKIKVLSVFPTRVVETDNTISNLNEQDPNKETL